MSCPYVSVSHENDTLIRYSVIVYPLKAKMATEIYAPWKETVMVEETKHASRNMTKKCEKHGKTI